MQKWVWLFILAFPFTIFSEGDPACKTGRLIVNISADASFSPDEFSSAASAALVQIEKRNPYKAFSGIFLETPFSVISPPLDEQSFGLLAKRFGYRTFNISNGSLQAAVAAANDLLQKIPRHSSEIPYASENDAARLYALMEKVGKALSDGRIKYWATAGTLLGAVRHQGLIPWDDDLDVCILEDDEAKLNALKDRLNVLGLEIYYHPHGYYKIFDKEGTPIEDSSHTGQYLPFNYPYADVFVMTLEMRKEFRDVYVHKSQYSYWNYPDERYHYSQIKDLDCAPFGPLMIPIPRDPEIYLNANYGTPQYPGLWRKYAVEPPWSHKCESDAAAGTALVEIDDF